MHAIIRRYDGVDQNRTAELTAKVNETLVPKLEKLSGFEGFYLIEAGNGVFSSLSLFETPEQGKESTNVVATWIRDEKLETLIPNEPKITSGRFVAHSDRVMVASSTAPHSTEGPASGPSLVPPRSHLRLSRSRPSRRARRDGARLSSFDQAIKWAQTQSWSVCLVLRRQQKPRLSGAFSEADDGTRTHDLLHGKQML